MSEGKDDREYEVVVNDEGQHSVWPTTVALPLGWRTVGVQGRREACLSHVEQVWKDLRPVTLRNRLAERR